MGPPRRPRRGPVPPRRVTAVQARRDRREADAAMAQRSISARSRASSRTRRCRAHRVPKLAAASHTDIGRAATTGNAPAPAVATIETPASCARDRAVELSSSAPARSLDARAVLHRHLSAAGQRRLDRHRPQRRGPEPAGLGVRRGGAAVPGRSHAARRGSRPAGARRGRSRACRAWRCPGTPRSGWR